LGANYVTVVKVRLIASADIRKNNGQLRRSRSFRVTSFVPV